MLRCPGHRACHKYLQPKSSSSRRHKKRSLGSRIRFATTKKTQARFENDGCHPQHKVSLEATLHWLHSAFPFQGCESQQKITWSNYSLKNWWLERWNVLLTNGPFQVTCSFFWGWGVVLSGKKDTYDSVLHCKSGFAKDFCLQLEKLRTSHSSRVLKLGNRGLK